MKRIETKFLTLDTDAAFDELERLLNSGWRAVRGGLWCVWLERRR